MATTAPRAPTVPTTAGTLAALSAVVCWGGGNVLVKYIHLSGTSLAFNRLVVGSLLFTGLLYATGGRLSPRALRVAIPGGIAFGADIVLFFLAVKKTSVADASVITALQPALVFLVAGPIFNERVTPRTVAWTAVATAGVVVAVLASAPTAGRTLGGDVLAAISLAAWSWYFVASKQARRHLSTLEYQAALTIVATIVVAPVGLAAHDLVIHDGATFGWVVVMVTVPGGGHVLMNWAHNHAPITLTSMITLGVPVVATLGAALALGETVTGVQAVGIAATVVALAMVIRRPAPARELEPEL